MAATCLALDIGNSRIKAALLHEGQIQASCILRRQKQLVTWRKKYASLPLYAINTRNSPTWKRLVTELGGTFLEAPVGLPFSTGYAPTLGPDRCAALCALHEMACRPFLYLSFGTALTGDFMDLAGIHRGGFISPGLWLRLKALNQKTGRLPLAVPSSVLPAAWGNATPEAILAGTVRGMLYEVQGHLAAFREAFGFYHLYVSGGEVDFWRPFLPAPFTFVPDLTLTGVWYWQRFLGGG